MLTNIQNNRRHIDTSGLKKSYSQYGLYTTLNTFLIEIGFNLITKNDILGHIYKSIDMPYIIFTLTNDHIFKIQSLSPKDDTYKEIHSVSFGEINDLITENIFLHGSDFTFFTFILDTIRNVWYDQNN